MQKAGSEASSGKSSPDSSPDSSPLSLRGFFLVGIRLAQNRLQILATEIAEEKVRLTLTAITGVAGLFFLGLAVVLGTLLLVVMFWDSHRIALLSILSGVFFLLGAVLLMLTVKSVSGKAPPFKVTLDELKKDEDVWRADKNGA